MRRLHEQLVRAGAEGLPPGEPALEPDPLDACLRRVGEAPLRDEAGAAPVSAVRARDAPAPRADPAAGPLQQEPELRARVAVQREPDRGADGRDLRQLRADLRPLRVNGETDDLQPRRLE